MYVTSGSNVYAAGFISRVQNSTNCTGDPGVNGRGCSTNVIYAPIITDDLRTSDG